MIIKDSLIFLRFPIIIAWWAHVIVIPEDSNATVFRKGIPIGLNVLIPFMGHSSPTWISGDNLEWKNAQKNDKKKNTSETINKIIPISKPFITSIVWSPFIVASRITSRHHWNLINKIDVIDTIRGIIEYPHIQSAEENITLNRAMEPRIGHGLTETKW